MSQFLPIPKPKHHRRQQNSNGGYCLVPAYTEQEMADFAALVAAAEREECAKVCESQIDAEYQTGKVDHNEMAWTQACAIAIRARGRQ